MKINKKYSIEHISIDPKNRLLIATQIQELYQFLWTDNSLDKILEKLQQYQQSYVSMIWHEELLVGFGIYHIETIKEIGVLFRNGAIIIKKHQSKHLYSAMVLSAYMAHKEQIDALCVRTREIQVYQTFLKLCESIPNAVMYPMDKQSTTTIPKKWLDIMQHFSGSNFPVANGIARKVYSIKEKTSFGNIGHRDAIMLITTNPH